MPGPPAGASTGVTLDADGSLDPGEANAAASLLWGSATEDGPFSRLDQAERGDEVTLRQSVGTSTTPADCVQRWRITRIFEPSAVPARTEPALLRLVGFDAEGEDLTVRFYVDAVPAPPQ